uniref:CCA-adding enzyme C-terminal domain-containing protein n=1 Tax=Archaeoglobus fulgidus TaxID=2234 RepID=A0A7J2TJH1_ARCFL
MAKFVQLSREFLRNPSLDFFIPRKKEVSLEEMREKVRKRGTEIILVEFERPNIVEDNLYPQLERAGRKIFEFLERESFSPIKFGFFAKKKCYLVFECTVKELSRITKKMGPIFEDEENVERFLAKEREFRPFLENGRWWAFEFRRHTKPEEAVSDYIRENYRSLGKNVGIKISEGFRILKGEEVLIPEILDELKEFLGVK